MISPRLALALAAPRILCGAPWKRSLAQDEVARSLVVQADHPRFTLDGDLYEARHGVTVETGPGVEIVVP